MDDQIEMLDMPKVKAIVEGDKTSMVLTADTNLQERLKFYGVMGEIVARVRDPRRVRPLVRKIR